MHIVVAHWSQKLNTFFSVFVFLAPICLSAIESSSNTLLPLHCIFLLLLSLVRSLVQDKIRRKQWIYAKYRVLEWCETWMCARAIRSGFCLSVTVKWTQSRVARIFHCHCAVRWTKRMKMRRWKIWRKKNLRSSCFFISDSYSQSIDRLSRQKNKIKINWNFYSSINERAICHLSIAKWVQIDCRVSRATLSGYVQQAILNKIANFDQINVTI